VTSQQLLPANGWYHRIGSTYDLSASTFEELSEEDKGAYVRVEKAEDLGEEHSRYLIPFATTQQEQQAVTFADVVDTLANIAADFIEVAKSDASSTSSEGSNEESPVTVVAEPEPVQETPQPPKPLQMEIVSGPSVAAGTVVKPGAKVVPVWEVKNVTGNGALWTDVRVKPIGPDPFNVGDIGFEAPVLQDGATGLLTLFLAVPSDIAPGPVHATFALIDGNGNVFGPQLALDVTVEQETNSAEANAVESLMDMGFGDAIACLKAIRASKGDVNAAALALLRAKK